MEPIKLDLSQMQIDTPLLKASASYNEIEEGPESFVETFQKAMDNLKDTHSQSEKLMQDYASGKEVDVSEVMLAMEKATMTTELAMQIRNKLVEGYQEIIKMQI